MFQSVESIVKSYSIADEVTRAFAEIRNAAASKGLALTTTAARTVFPIGTHYVSCIPRNFATAVVARIALIPYLFVVKTNDAFASLVDYSKAAQDSDDATNVTLSSQKTLADGGAVYVGSPFPIRGFDVDVDAANANASVIAVHYWNGTAWTVLTVTDNTASGGATFAVDGLMTWTAPTDGIKANLGVILRSQLVAEPYSNISLYWYRVTVSAALDSSTTLNSLLALPRSTAYAEFPSGEKLEFRTEMSIGGVAGVEALTDAGTANLIVNVFASSNDAFSA